MTPLSCSPQSRCNFLVLRTPVLLCQVLDLDTYGGVDPLGVFPLFLKIVADIIAPTLSIIFHGLIRQGSFPECWQSANVTFIPNGAPSPDRKNCPPISITPIVAKVYEKLISSSSQAFARNMVYFLLLGLLIGKVCSALMHCLPYLITFRSPSMQGWSLISVSSTLVQPSIEWGTVVPSILFGPLFKLKSIGVGGNVLSIGIEFLSDRRQRVVVDGAMSEWIPIISAPGKCVGSSSVYPFIPAKCLSRLRTDYLPMQMTPHYWQLFASRPTCCCCLH